MDEQQIRALEIEVGRKLGCKVVRTHPDGSGWRLMTPWGIHASGSRRLVDSELESYFKEYCPRFARDPAAVLEALTWLASDTKEANSIGDPRQPIDQVCVFCGPEKATIWLDPLPLTGCRHEGETLGIAICRAIIALNAPIAIQQAEEEG